VEPYVLAMEAQDKVGKTLRSHHLAESIMAAISPLAKTVSSPEARFRQLHIAMRDSSRSGHAHVLVIEEAHSLPLATLKHLKRFRELKDGLRPLLSIILLGQPELAAKLSEHNPEVREVVQRIEIVTLPALNSDLDAYLKHRFARIGIPSEKIFARDAIEALRTKFTPSRASATLLYPLAVANALTAAMNRAAEIKMPQVTADVIRGV
jgi:type II secretory pathway predicted ATPase ExeA